MSYVHPMSYGYVMKLNFIYSSHCDDMTFISTTGLCSSHYDDKTFFVRLWWHDICVTLWQREYVCDIATIWLCLSHCNNVLLASHVHHIVTLWLYVCHIATIWLWQVMFVTLQKYGYVRRIAILGAMFVKWRDSVLCSSQFKIRGYIRHIS